MPPEILPEPILEAAEVFDLRQYAKPPPFRFVMLRLAQEPSKRATAHPAGPPRFDDPSERPGALEVLLCP